MKTKVSLLALVIFFTGANLVFAQANFSTVKEDGSNWIETSTFEFNERPWLRITTPESSFYDNWTFAYWNYPALSASYQTSNYFNPVTEFKHTVGDNKLFISLDETFWNTVARRSGDWNVSAATILFTSTGAPNYSNILTAYNGNTSFTVNPEPVSCALFLLGGGTLAIAGRFRKKAQVKA